MQVHIDKGKPADFDSKQAIVRLIDGTTINGWVNLKYCTRIADLLNKYDDQFIVLFDCSLRDDLGNVLLVNKKNILWVAPVEK
ncbi:hypothetical protein [Desulfonatronospira sp.]|uniref:DUF6812 domain-containing protein n=1 Tax=Desulfonatronospira sp. TaxID=1962951 RepID=UPI0025B9AD21|nr:hypothetical protein [Desulfonatronospira sp.]